MQAAIPAERHHHRCTNDSLNTIERGSWRIRWYEAETVRKARIAVDMLVQLLALHVVSANVQEREVAEELTLQVQIEIGDSVTLAYVDQGFSGSGAREAAAEHGIALEAVKLPEVKCGFVSLPRRWVAERTPAWFARFRRLARNYERLDKNVRALFAVAAILMLLAWGNPNRH